MTQLNMIKVGMADLNTIKGAGIIKTIGLGSCVGVAIYDAVSQVAGLAHVMLPHSNIAREKVINYAKYADTAIPYLLEKMYNEGANHDRLKAKLAGGAQMFTYNDTNHDTMRIGARNIEAVKAMLQRFNIPISGEDTGGNYGRTIEFHNDTSILVVRSIHKGVKEI